ncbi:MAG TPA: 3-hydroxybutyryl-CoA dehydrogenase, partial [Nitrospinae bacterium]|nr:3-hydroxybutyryl-CoA dehydrogenase [Nitrospinota bacterium]
VVGAGTMGAGIAQIFAQGGIPVTLTDQSEDIVAKAVAGLEKRMARRVEQGKMSAGDKD